MARTLTSIPTPVPLARTRPLPSLLPGDLAKRAVDIGGAFIGLALLLPIFAVVALLIRRHSSGPIFYRATRIGKDGKKFAMLKFRTMEQWHDPRQLAKVTAEDDPRVTPFGRRLRNSKINELPQLWNVLKGEMSFVGPRPEDPDIAAKWPEAVRREILSVKPGITSPASVLYRNEEGLLSHQNLMQTYLKSVLPSKLRLDQLYVRRHSFWLDLDVLLWTALIVLPGIHTALPEEEGLFLGPLTRLGRRYVSWFAIDAFITFLAMGVTGVVWRWFVVLNVGWGQALLIAGGFALLFSLVGWLLGMNRIAWSHALSSDVWLILLSASVAGAAAVVFNQILWTQPMLPPGMVVSASASALVGFVGVRYRTRLLSGAVSRWLAVSSGQAAMRERVLIIGGGSTGQFVAWLLGNGPNASAFQVVGFIDDDLYKQGMRFRGLNVLGRRTDICRLVEKYDVGILIFAIHNISAQDRHALLDFCGGTQARLVMVPDIAASLADAVADKAAAKDDGSNGHRAKPTIEAPLTAAQGISPAQAQMWLSDLEQMVQAGDLAGAGDRIRTIREGLLTHDPHA